MKIIKNYLWGTLPGFVYRLNFKRHVGGFLKKATLVKCCSFFCSFFNDPGISQLGNECRHNNWGASMDMRFSSNSPDINSIALSFYYNPLVGKKLKWIPSLMAEYFYGRAESLLYYKGRTNSIRVGIALM